MVINMSAIYQRNIIYHQLCTVMTDVTCNTYLAPNMDIIERTFSSYTIINDKKIFGHAKMRNSSSSFVSKIALNRACVPIV